MKELKMEHEKTRDELDMECHELWLEVEYLKQRVFELENELRQMKELKKLAAKMSDVLATLPPSTPEAEEEEW